ncbi:hypothetical protein BN1708_011840, partial [Verticillium longisporum]
MSWNPDANPQRKLPCRRNPIGIQDFLEGQQVPRGVAVLGARCLSSPPRRAVAQLGDGKVLGGWDVRVCRRHVAQVTWQLVHGHAPSNQTGLGEDQVQQDGVEDKGRDDGRHNHVSRVVDKLDAESASKDKIGGVARNENGRPNVGSGELGEDPSARRRQILGYAGHVRQKGGAAQYHRVVSNERREPKEKHVEVEVETAAVVASPLEDLEGEKTNEPRGIYGDGNVGQGDEEEHDVERRDVVGAQRALADLLPANGTNGEEEKIGHDGSRDEIHRKPDFDVLVM